MYRHQQKGCCLTRQGTLSMLCTALEFAGGKPHDEREDAYAAMKKKQVVHLSKDSLNQFNQVSIQAPDSTSASQPQVQPRPSALGDSSQTGSHRRGAISNSGESILLTQCCACSQADCCHSIFASIVTTPVMNLRSTVDTVVILRCAHTMVSHTHLCTVLQQSTSCIP